MKPELKQYIERCYIKASHDLITARIMLEHNPLVLDVVCFHCQQAVKKYLKAFLASYEKEIIKTHNLNFLQTQCAEMDTDFNDFDFKQLGEFAVDVRYPDDFLMPELTEAKEYLLMAEELERMVKGKIVF